MEKLRKKREKKFRRKKNPEEEQEESSDAEPKKKDTIWKIVLPNVNRKNATSSERRVVDKVESLIDKNPRVMKSLSQLHSLENGNVRYSKSEKEKFTIKKNRISAQLSRDRRSAIVQSLMELCVQNVSKRDEIETDLDEAKEILQKTLCNDCKGNLKMAGSSPRKDNRKRKGASSNLSVKGKGNAIILSILAASVALVSLYSGSGQKDQVPAVVLNSPLNQHVDSQKQYGRNLMSSVNLDNLNTAIQVYSGAENYENQSADQI